MANALIGALRIPLSINAGKFARNTKEAGGQLDDLGRRAKRLGRNMARIGGILSTTVTGPIVAFGAGILRAGGDFQKAMNRVTAVSGATGDEIEKLKAQAKELGATTQFSASQAADAMGFLAMAGFDANKIMGAMPGTLQLAASAQLDLAKSADIVSNVLTGYNMDVKQLSRVNDVLVKTFTSTNTDLVQLGEAMKYAGPVASAAGVKFEESAAAIGLMGNAGIQASMAGTSLRGAISRMLAPTKQMRSLMQEAGLVFTDAQGRLLPLDQIVQSLEPHADDAGLMMKLFGLRAGPAMAALVSQGSDQLRKLTGELENSGGTAKRIADVQMKGFSGAMKELRSAFEALQIAIAESGLLDLMTDAARGLAQFFRELSQANPALLKWGTLIAGIAAIVGPAILVLGGLVAAIGAIAPALTAAGAGIAALVAAAGPIGLFIAAATLAYTAWQLWGDKITVLFSQITEFITSKFDWILDKTTAVTDGIQGAWQYLKDTLVGNSIIPDMVDEIGDEFQRLDSLTTGWTTKTVSTLSRGYGKAAKLTTAQISDMGSNINTVLGTMFKDSKAASIAQAIISTLTGMTRALELPFPANLAAAAAVAAQGYANVAAIKSTNVSGGGGGGSSSTAGSAAGSAAQGGQTQPNQNVMINLHGQNFGRDQVRGLISQINDLVSDGVELQVSTA